MQLPNILTGKIKSVKMFHGGGNIRNINGIVGRPKLIGGC